MFFGAAGALLVVVVVVAVVVMMTAGGKESGPARTAVGEPIAQGIAPSSYSDSPSTAVFKAIEERSADPDPLTLGEAFPKEARSLPGPGGKGELSLRDKRLDTDCAQAVWGAGVGGLLRAGGCAQVVRGIYSDTRYAVTVGVFNLAGVEDANRLAAAFGDGGGFVRPLGDFGRGFSMARGLAMGHYVVVGWVQRLDGKGDAQDEALLSLLVEAGGSKAVLGRAARSR
jgi:hypothetical protein